MKTKLISRIGLGAALSMFIAVNSFAQKASSKDELTDNIPSYEITKVASSGNYNIPGNIEKPKARLEQLGDNLLVTFTTDESSTSMLFDKTGRMIYSINYCSEKQLPQDVKRLIKDKYEDYEITSAAKVLQENESFWLINLAGENNYVGVRLEGNEMSEVENFKKAN